MDAGRLAHALDRVAGTGRVLYIAAHPDDENTRLLAHLANERHVETAYLSLTRGGGGQNLIGSELGELLDVIRTEELLAARRLDGARQYFSSARDFGYSKSGEETLSIWGHEAILADVVWVLRTFRPDVIVTRFNEVPPNHGHHIASFLLAKEAFEAAADPKRFPEQLAAGATTWQVERLLYNVSTWRDEAIPEGAIPIDVGGYDPRLGMGFAELAARSRSEHKSQGFGASGKRGRVLEHLTWVMGSKPEGDDLLQGIELGWGRFGAAAKPLEAALAQAREALHRDHPERALPALARAHGALDALPDVPRVRDARVSLQRILGSAAGLFLRATSPQAAVTPGGALQVELEAVLGREAEVSLGAVRFPGAALTSPGDRLIPGEKVLLEWVVEVPEDAKISTPHWLERPHEAGRFSLDPQLAAAPLGPPALQVEVELSVAGAAFEVALPVIHTWTDRVHGERIRQVAVVPPATVTPSRQALLFPNGEARRLSLLVRAGADGVAGVVEPGLPAGWEATPAQVEVSFERAGDERLVHFEIRPFAGAEEATIAPRFAAGGRAWSFREDRIDYPHIPPQTVLRQASLRLVPLEAEIPEGIVGYLPGAGDTVADDLIHLGVTVDVIDGETLRSGDLGRYDSIVIGVRAYNTRPELRGAHQRLMAYVEGGGTVLVQYNTTSPWAPLTLPLGPFDLELGSDRVTDEEAEVGFVDPGHQALQAPNRITAKDFEGWVQERGLYFASTWDPRYEPLFSMSDEGEERLVGSTLVARHGAGRYVYTGLSFFRQLPAGVPGAYRLFLNLISPTTRAEDDQAAR